MSRRNRAVTDSPLVRLVLSRAEGVHVWDREGRRYLDATSGAFCVQLGYTRPDLVRAMAEAAERLPYARPSQFESEESLAYRRELLAAAGPPFTRVVLTSSGSEAVDAALKIAHVYQGAVGHPERVRVDYRSGHFHGATLGALGVTGWRARRAPYEALLGMEQGESGGDGGGASPMTEVTGGEAAALILETIPAVGAGVRVPVREDLAATRARCDASGALWIADEVLTGFGRVGELFAWQRIAEGPGVGGDPSLVPDLVVFGKGAGAGFAPVAGVLIAERVARVLDETKFSHYQTYGGNPIAAAVGRQVLRAIAEEGVYASVREDEVALWSALNQLRGSPHVSDVRGLGYLWGIDLREDVAADRAFPRDRRIAERVAAACRGRGVLVHAGLGGLDAEQGDFVLIAPPLVTPPDDFQEIASALEAAIESVAR